jgi:hypothetical protein
MRAAVEEIASGLTSCRALVRAAAQSQPEAVPLLVLVELDARGCPELVAPAFLDVAPGTFALTDALHCLMKRLEQASYPAVGAPVVLPFHIDVEAAARPPS